MLANNQVHQGDCVRRLREIEPGSVHLAFADPPFNIGYDYDVYDDRRHATDYLDWSRNWIQGVHRALRDDGTFWLAIGDEFAAELKLIAQQDVGFHCRSWVIWYYTFGVNCKRGFSRSHTHLFHFVKDPDCFTFNADNPAVRIPSARQLVYADGRANPKGRLPDNTWIYRPQDLPGGLPLEHDTWYYPRVAGTFKEREGFHGCQMPEQLLGRIIRVSSKPTEVVLDPFSGSGTTLCVAKKLGRQFLGVELSKDYVRHIRKRLKATHAGDPLDGKEDPSRSAPKTKEGKQRSGVNRTIARARISSLDPEVVQQIITAFSETHEGRPADHVIACPELNQKFTSACRTKDLPGSATLWNRVILQTRKRGKLPRNGRRLPTPRIAEQVSYASEIAIQQVTIDTGMSVDSVLCDPELARLFDQLAANFAPGHPAFEYRWAALALRKQLRTAKRAVASVRDGDKVPLTEPISLQTLALDELATKGVFSLESHRGAPVYIGLSNELPHRIRQIRQVDAWAAFDIRAVRIFPAQKREVMLGLKAALVQQLHPLLNYHGYLNHVNSAA